eukprot:365649-Chlamydomonas_euryale.AAC.3
MLPLPLPAAVLAAACFSATRSAMRTSASCDACSPCRGESSSMPCCGAPFGLLVWRTAHPWGCWCGGVTFAAHPWGCWCGGVTFVLFMPRRTLGAVGVAEHPRDCWCGGANLGGLLASPSLER